MSLPRNRPICWGLIGLGILFGGRSLDAQVLPANPSYSNTTGDTIRDHDFGTVRLGAASPVYNFSVYNVGNPGTTSPMSLSSVDSHLNTDSFALQTGTVSGLPAGSHADMQLRLLTNLPGRVVVSYTMDFNSDSPSSSPAGRLALAGHAIVTPPGDYDVDGDVDETDLGIWRSHFGAAYPAADGNGNGIVDAPDYLIWRKFYTGPLGTSTSANRLFASVPEPGAAALGLIALSLLRGRYFFRKRSCWPL
jgi:hypothetical protein